MDNFKAILKQSFNFYAGIYIPVYILLARVLGFSLQYSSCMWGCMLYGSENWPGRTENVLAPALAEMRGISCV